MSNVGQAASSILGATIGFVFGGPTGALYGFQAGLLGGSALFPTQLPGVQGPRLEDFERLNADPGAPRWQVFGTAPVPGFRMYLGPVTEISTTEEVGGKGPPEQEVTTFQYFQTLGLGLCDGPIAGIGRIWENGQLMYDPRVQQAGEALSDYETRIAMSDEYAETFTLYLGDEEQLADPTLELEQGTGRVPAWRGHAYLVFPDRELKSDQGNRHPAFKIEVAGHGDLEHCDLALEELATVDDWASPARGGRRSSCSLTDGVVTEQTCDYTADDLSVVVTSVDTDRFFKRWTRTFGTDGVQTDEASQQIHTLDDHVSGFAIVQVQNSSLIMAGRKSAAGVGSDVSAWYVNGVLGNRPIVPPGGTNYFNAIGSSVPRISAMHFVPGVGVYVANATTDASNKAISRYPVVGNSPASNPDAHILISNALLNSGAHGVIGYDTDDRVYAWRNGDIDGAGSQPNVLRLAGDLSQILETWVLPDIPWDVDTFRVVCGRYLLAGPTVDAVRVYDLENNLDLLTTFQLPGNGNDSPRFVGDHRLYYHSSDELWRIADEGLSGVGTGIAIERILTLICAQAGLQSIDASDHADNLIDGYALTRETSARGAIEPIRSAGLFDIVESESQIKFPARGKAVVATLTEDELGVVDEGEEPAPKVTTRKLQDVELPRQLRLRYLSVARDYEQAEQLSPARIGTVGINDITVDLPIVLSDDRARQIAEVMFREAWASRWSHDFSVDCSRYTLEPSDPVLVPVDGRQYRVRIVDFNDAGLVIRQAVAVRDDDGSYVSVAIDAAPQRPPAVVSLLGETEAELLDLPALREQDDNAGVYVAARRGGTGTTWQGARIHRSVDTGATYSQILAITAQAAIGTVVAAPTAGDGYTWDDAAEYVIDVLSGTLSSRTDAAVLAGANAASVGAHGRWHLFQFANAELISPGRYRLSRLLLGRRGTEHLIDTVEVGDTFVLVSGSGIVRAPLQSSEIGVSRIYRAVTSGAPFSSGEDQAFTGAGQALETFSPVYVRGERDGGNNLTISWLRRDRLSQTLRDGVPTPMSEATESYEVDILDEYDQVVRTLVSATNQVAYSAANQTTDFGGPQASVSVRVYQLSAVIGRGTPAEAIV